MQTQANPKLIKKPEEFIKHWGSFRLYDESPMQTYFRQIDLQFREETQGKYIENALQMPPEYMNQLLLTDWRFRADAKMNIIASTEGEQGSGKSLSSSYACLLLAKIFGSVFSPANVVYDPEELDKKLETAAYRSTWLLDEQKKTNVGIMSQTTNLRLADFEDQLRYSQINLWYASPTLRDHTHFFIFETFKIERVKPEESPICAVCTKIRENPTVCHDCKVPEQERIGYPKSFLLMLKTKRLLEPYPVPRGLVRFKMPNPHFSKEYDELKKAHIKKLQNKESQFWEILKEKANKIWELDSEKLIVTQKNGNLAPANSKKIRISIYDKFGMRAFTKEAEDLLCELIAQKAQEHIMRTGENDGG